MGKICQILQVLLEFSFILMLHINMNVIKRDGILLNNLLVVTRMLIAKNWKLEKIPTLKEWQMKYQHVLLMRKLTMIHS